MNRRDFLRFATASTAGLLLIPESRSIWQLDRTMLRPNDAIAISGSKLYVDDTLVQFVVHDPSGRVVGRTQAYQVAPEGEWQAAFSGSPLVAGSEYRWTTEAWITSDPKLRKSGLMI